MVIWLAWKLIFFNIPFSNKGATLWNHQLVSWFSILKYPLVILLAGLLLLPVVASRCKAFPILQLYGIINTWNSLKTVFDLVTLPFDLWTWPWYPSTWPTSWISGPYVCPFVQESGNTLTDSLTHTHIVKTITPTADAGCNKGYKTCIVITKLFCLGTLYPFRHIV